MSHNPSRIGIALVVFLLFPCPSFAADYQSTYVTPEDLPPQLLVPPPAEGSAAWKKDIQDVLRAQRHVSESDLAAMRDEQHVRLDSITSGLGPNFTREKLPKTFALLDHVFTDALVVTEADKKFWHTRRPYLTDPRVKLYVDRIDSSPGYPSGHTSSMRVVAEILGVLMPDRLQDLRIRAEAIAHHREEAGAHSPSDLEGGRMLAMLIVGALLKSDAFQDDLAAAREEIAPHD